MVTGNSWGGHVSPGEWDDQTGDLSIQSSTPNWSQNDNTVLRFDASTLHQVDFFTPYNSNYMDGENEDGANDQDLGASTITILPAGLGGGQYPNLGIVGGKNSTLFLVDLDNLGGYRMGAGRADAIVDEFYLYDISATRVSLTNSPGVSVADGLIYFALPGDQLYAFKLVQNSAGVPKLTLAGQTRLGTDKLLGGGASSPTVLTNGQAALPSCGWPSAKVCGPTAAFRMLQALCNRSASAAATMRNDSLNQRSTSTESSHRLTSELSDSSSSAATEHASTRVHTAA